MMPQPPEQQTARLTRYQAQSVRLLHDAMNEARQNRWLRCEELLWGSVTLAVKGVALTRGDQPDSRDAVEQYAQTLGRQQHDRRIRDVFSRLNSFADAADRAGESRSGAQRLVAILDDITAAAERMLAMLPQPETTTGPDSQLYDDEPAPPPPRRSRRRPRQRRKNTGDDDA